jgi:plasmid stabilization system protein ParE
MRVRYTPRAFADREAIFEYLDQRNPQAARKVKAFIDQKIASLSYAPRRARFVKGLGVHSFWLGRYPYIVYIGPRRRGVDRPHPPRFPPSVDGRRGLSLPAMVNRLLTCPLLW